MQFPRHPRIEEIQQAVADAQWQALWESMGSESSRIMDVAADRFSEDEFVTAQGEE